MTIGIILTYKHASFLENLYRSLPTGVFDSIIVADDDSGDGIAAVAKRLGILCFSHQRLGYGGNIKYGLQKAMEMGGDYMVEIHGDGQYDVRASGPGIEKIRHGYDYVMGSRFMQGFRKPLQDKMPIERFLANIGLSFLARLVLGVPLTEFHNGFRVYSRQMLTKLNLENTSNDFLYGFEIIALVAFKNLKMAEVPIRCFYTHEHSSITIPKAIQYAFQMSWVLVKYIFAKLGFQVKLFKLFD